MATLLDFGPVTGIMIAEGGHSCRYEPLQPPVMTYDGRMHSQVTQYRGYVRVWSLVTPEMAIADARALVDALREAGTQVVDSALVGSSISCHPSNVRLTFGTVAQRAAVSFDLRQTVTASGQDRKELVRVWVANAADDLVNLSAWLIRGSVTKDIEQFAKTATLVFMRESGEWGSIAPLVADPEPIAEARRVRIEFATVAHDATPTDSDWWVEFEGKTDDVDWGGNAPRITVPCRDKGGDIIDTFIDEVAAYGNEAGTATQQDVLQALLDAWMDPAPTLDVVGDPDQGVLLYNVTEQSLYSAGDAVVELNGRDWRYLWDDTAGEELLALYEPPYSKTTPDRTFASSAYYEITGVARSRKGIRNRVRVKITLANGDTATYTGEDAASIALYGTRSAVLDETQNSQIVTEAAALALGEAFLAATAYPALSHVARHPLQRVDLNDLCRYTANNVHYTADQDVAVMSVTTTFGPDGTYTDVAGAVKPRGPQSRWWRKIDRAERKRETDPPPEVEVPTLSIDDLGAYYTTKSGSAGFSLASTGPESLGKYISTTKVGSELGDIFEEITEADRVAGVVKYRTLGIANRNSYGIDWEGVVGWLEFPDDGDIDWAIALDPNGVVDLEDTSAQGGESADDETEPSGTGSLTWVSPDAYSHADRLQIGRIAPSRCVLVHVRLTVTAGATSRITDEVLRFRETLPADP